MTTHSTTQFDRSRSLLVAGALLGVLSGAMGAQQPQASPASSAMDESATSPSPAKTDSNLSSTGSRDALTAAQIDSILQRKPEVVVEMKSLLADQLQQQGATAQADSITDEALFARIASSAEFRATITLWLQARGYVSQADLHRSSANSATDDEESAPPTGATFDSLTQLPGSQSGRDEALLTTQTANAAGFSTRSAGGATTSPTSANRSLRRRAANQPDADQPAETDGPRVLHVPAPYNLLSLRDLYTQLPDDNVPLKRFGSEVFLNRSGSPGLGPRDAPLDLPIGPDYILGVGDGLTINLWGGISQSLTRVVDREGKITLPEAGSLVVAGLSLQRATSLITDALKRQFHDAQVDVTIARLRTVRVYVVGDVQAPGAYDLSSLSTPLNALYAAGGPTSVGSLRIVRHYRGKQLVREDDLYDFLLHGARMDDERLESGDTLLVPPAGPQVAVSGMVKRPAIYELKAGSELKGETSLADVLADAGGTTVAAALNHITIERIQPNQQRETVSLDPGSSAAPQSALQAIAAFKIKDGDRVHVAGILPYSERVIYVEGHVARPGRYPYRDGMLLGDVLKSYQDLLPEPASKADIVRLVPPDLHPETIPFDVPEVLIGNSNFALQPFDTIRIFGRYEVDSPQVAIRGEVLRPGLYALSQGMTASQLVKMAGGFRRDALLQSADLTSYSIQDGKKVVSQRETVSIGAAVQGDRTAVDVPLKPGDVLAIHQISGWNDIGASIVLDGEVTYPGSYGLQEGERLSSVLRRAGGCRSTAYPAGAVLVRTQVRELEEKSRTELIRQIETASASARLSPNLNGQDQAATLQAVDQQQAEVLQRLRNQPVSGRLVIHIGADIASWENTPADIEMRAGDVLTVPKCPSFVMVSGQAYNPSAITFAPGKDAAWYLRRAGGTNDVANRKDIFIVQANGSVVGRRSGGWHGGGVLSTHLAPGDVIVVPQKILGGSLFWRNLLTVAQIASSVTITAAVAGVL